MEDRIAEAPDDIETRRVVADWLIERGDPRGELIAAHLASEAGNTEVASEIARLETVLSGRWATPPAGVDLEIRWSRGYWHALEFATRDDALAELLPALLADPSARFLRELYVGEIGTNRPYDPYLEQLPVTLDRVRIGNYVGSKDGKYASWSHITLPPNVREIVFSCIADNLEGLP
jgi:uncharacterized protein (TIGR02996 family)